MKTLMDHVQEFTFDTMNETIKRFTPEQAEYLKIKINASCKVNDAIKILQSAVSNVLNEYFEILRYDMWEGANNDDN